MKQLVILSVLIVGIQACTPEKIVKDFTIEGQITEAGTGKPLKGIGVFVLEEEQSVIAGTNRGISESIKSDSNGFYKIQGTTRASGTLNLIFNQRFIDFSSFEFFCESKIDSVFKSGKNHVVNFLLVSQNYIQFNYDSIKSFEIDSLSISIANNNLLKPLTLNSDFEDCNFCYPNKNPNIGLPITNKYCFEETPELFQKSYSGVEAINSFYELYTNTTILSNFENTIGIKAYNNGTEVYNKSVTYNFKSDETTKTIKF